MPTLWSFYAEECATRCESIERSREIEVPLALALALLTLSQVTACLRMVHLLFEIASTPSCPKPAYWVRTSEEIYT